jgi:hypothetical protein
MNEKLLQLVGATVLQADLEQSILKLRLSDDRFLVITNRCLLENSALDSWPVAAQDLASILDQSVTAVSDLGDSFKLSFDNGKILNIDLQDEAWTGPEAAVLYEGSVPVVVWS